MNELRNSALLFVAFQGNAGVNGTASKRRTVVWPERVESGLQVVALFSIPGNVGFTDSHGVGVEGGQICKDGLFLHSSLEFTVDVMEHVTVAVVINEGVAAGGNARRWFGRGKGKCWESMGVECYGK